MPTRDARVGNKAYKSVNLLIVGFGDSPNHPGEIRGGSRCGRLAATSLVRNFEGIMAAAAAFLNPTYESPSRDEVLARYRRLREIGAMHCSRATAFLSADAVLRQSRRLGLDRDGSLDGHELTMALDLAIYAAPVGCSRAIDRYARSAQHAPGSDAALVLEAMRNARFAVVSVQRRHPAAGLIVTDLFRKADFWLVNWGFENSLPEHSVFATRYFAPEDFAMTTGAAIPVDVDLLRTAVDSMPLCRLPSEVIDHWRFPEVVYRIAIAQRVTETTIYKELFSGQSG